MRANSATVLVPAVLINNASMRVAGCVANLIFTYMGAIIRDATTAMLMCFAVDRDNGTSSHEDESVKEALSGLPCVYAQEQNIQLVVQQQPVVQAVPVTEGVPVATPINPVNAK